MYVYVYMYTCNTYIKCILHFGTSGVIRLEILNTNKKAYNTNTSKYCLLRLLNALDFENW